MNIQTIVKLELSEKEVIALRKLLGQHSRETSTAHGLTIEQAQICTDIFNALPELEISHF